MKTIGIILLIAGIAMCIFNTVHFTEKKKVVDLGPIQIDKKEEHTVQWPLYAGIGVGLFGIALLATDKKTK